MDATQLSNVTAVPMQIVGMSFYFDPFTVERGRERGLRRFEYYGLGRGGVLGDVDASVVDEAFTFFHPSTFDFIWTGARTKADPDVIAKDYLQAAYEFADRTFGAVPPGLLVDFAAAARKVASAVQRGHYKLVDGYLEFPAPKDPVHAAYLGAILMRELRGGVHIDAVREADIQPVEACYLQDPDFFKYHGYQEEDAPTVTPELEAKKLRAEEITNRAMAACFAVLSDQERQQLGDGAVAMFDAVKSPVAVRG